MRICLVSHGFPPSDRTGVENYTESLARTFAHRGHAVLVFAPRRDPDAGHLSLRIEDRDGFSIHWIALNRDPADPAEALDSGPVVRQFARFLDRERPEVVHFQHVVKLGIGCLREAHARDLPVVYTAHDYFAICHRYTLLRPDLRHCDVRGDSMACARCDLAAGFLNGVRDLGDYQAGVFADQLDQRQATTLEGILQGDSRRSGLSEEDEDAAFDRRRALDAERSRAFASVDLFLAPSRYLCEELVRGGIERERIEVLPYGIRNDDLHGLRPPAADDGRPIRFGYFGGHSKQKGVHVLLEAFARLGGSAELVVHGYATDEPYGDRVRELASASGAFCQGPYRRSELPELLAEVDVVVVPSTWVENQPIVIREAFSARRPVIASRFGALTESVRDGVDGLLFEVGDAEDLECALRRASDHAFVRALSRGIAPVKDVETQATELLERYEDLCERLGRDGPPSVLASLSTFDALHRSLDRMPVRELFGRVLGGLARLREGLGAEAGDPSLDTLLEDALSRGSRVQTSVWDAALEQAWLRDLVSRTKNEREWYRELVGGKEAERASLDQERTWLREQLERHVEERAWLRRTLGERERELDWRSQTLEERDREREWLRRTLEEREKEVDSLRGRVVELERGRAELAAAYARIESSLDEKANELQSVAEIGLAALAAQERAMRDALAGLLRILGKLDGGAGADLDGLLASIRDATGRADELTGELDWRRGEMSEAVHASRRRFVALFIRRSGLGRRLATWESEGAGGEVAP